MTDLKSQLPDPAANDSRTGVETAMQFLASSITATPRDEGSSQRAPRPHTRRAFTVVAAAAACVLAALIGVTQLIDGGSAQPEWAAADIAVAEQSPLLLLQGAGWNVASFSQFTPKNQSGGMQFKSSTGAQPVTLYWEPRGHLKSTRRRLSSRSVQLPMITIDGHRAQLFREHSEGGSMWTGHNAMWIAGKYLLTLSDEYHGHPSKVEDDRFIRMASRLKSVSTDQLLSNLPKDYLLPSKIPGAATEILADVPLPAGYSTESVLTNLQSSSHTGLAQRLITNVQCAWVSNWVAARKHGDAAEMKRIGKAVAGYRSWKYARLKLVPENVKITIGIGFMDSLSRGGRVIFKGYPTQDIGKIQARDDMGCKF
jgi:hypothetical protein